MAEFPIERHIKYFKRCLDILPSRLQKEDSNKLMIVYCCIGGLSLLNYKFSSIERQNYTDFIYSHYLSSGEGFRGSMTHALPKSTRYDPPTVANTYCALCILLMLEEDYSERLDKEGMMKYLKKCQTRDGGFKSIVDINEQPFGDGDLRQTYMACCIRSMLKYEGGENDIAIDLIEKYIKNQVVFDGGIGIGESHAGYGFCGLASLKLIGKLKIDEWDKTLDWLAHRQLDFNKYNDDLINYEFLDQVDKGAHNGRENKFGDTCYSYWCAGALSLFNKEFFINDELNELYLLTKTQNLIIGGFAKTDSDDPDPYHSFLGLAALTIIESQTKKLLNPIDPTLSITQTATNFLKSLYRS